MSRNKNTAPSEAKPDTVEGTEQAAPAGVETVEADAPSEAKPEGYTVVWHIKTGGKRYAPGDTIDLDGDTAAPFLKSGAITEKG